MMIILAIGLFSRYRSRISYRLFYGKNRYQALAQDEEGSLIVSQTHKRRTLRNTHAMPSDSDDEDDTTLFVSNTQLSSIT